MTVVQNTLIDETSSPIRNVPVVVELVGTGEPNESFVANDSQIVSKITTKTNSSGQWALDLIPNDEIEPAGSTYLVTHSIPGYDDETLTFIVPPAGATPGIHHLHDLLV